jgi:two-component system CheB/CheR fusion protein
MTRRKTRSPPEIPPTLADAFQADPALRFPIVCTGASAGGLEALSRMFAALPTDTGMAFVVILHMDPHHESRLGEILGRGTAMPVSAVQAALTPEPDHIYVSPPGHALTIHGGRLELEALDPGPVRRPIDRFMRSLAEHQGAAAIGVVLSGMGSDGTLGLAEIKAAGGITLAQDNTAEQPSMPRSAIAAGCVDFVLSPDDIAHELARIARHPYASVNDDGSIESADQSQIGHILDLVRHACRVDFANYKRNTLHRRISRRVLLHKLDSLQDYVYFLRDHPAEIDALCEDILINVTSFFRNPEAYEALKAKVFPRLGSDDNRGDPVRVWTLGCSTGEEAYSIAMAYAEFADGAGLRQPIQIFATDLNATGIERARAGIYPRSIDQDVSAERLRRFFIEVEGGYRVCKPIRDACVFARQNVLSDPPFSRMDLISCRNMLIYLEPALQQKLLPMLHYALRPNGRLWLGSSETIGSFRDLFELEDTRNKIYAKKPVASGKFVQVPISVSASMPEARELPMRSVRLPDRPTDPQREADRMLLARYAPPAVVVDAGLEIIQFRGDTSPFLTPAPGRASLNLLKMLRDGLLVPVRGAVHKARREESLVREPGVRVKTERGARDVDVVVAPLKGIGVAAGCLLVTFEDTVLGAELRRQADDHARRTLGDMAPPESGEEELLRTRQELASTRDYLQSVIEQQEAANEELQSANEEVQSANEELQSINEELETSKEEIQSSNEELATVNDELQNRNQELAESNDDLTNLLANVQMAIVMLGRDLRIRRFTPAAEKLLNLIAGDIGRPIGDIKPRVDVPNLEALLLDAIDSVTIKELEVQDLHGRWYLLRIRPYKTHENTIDGAVLVLVDIDTIKRAERTLRDQAGKPAAARKRRAADKAAPAGGRKSTKPAAKPRGPRRK